MNLHGFCGADPSACGLPPGGTKTAPGFNPQLTQAAIEQYPNLASSVGNFLYQVAARIGRTAVCPHLPSIGAFTGEAIAAALLPEEVVLLGVPGFAIGVSSIILGRVVGAAVGGELQSILCQ